MEFNMSTKELLEKYRYDFVIGSMHNLRHSPDFSQFIWSEMDDSHIEYYFRKSLEEIDKIIDFDGINTVAHINYPVRYIRRAGKDIKYDVSITEDIKKTIEEEYDLFYRVRASVRKQAILNKLISNNNLI